MKRYGFYEVRLVHPQPLEPISGAWRITGDELEKDFETKIKAFDYLGNLGAYLKIQTKSGIFIFERPLSPSDKLIRCSGCLNQFTRDQVVYVDSLPYCSHCLNDERMEHEDAETFYGLQTCRGCQGKFPSDEVKYFDSDPYCKRCLDKNIGGYEDE